MEPAETRRAVGAAISAAWMVGLAVDDTVVLNDSNRLVVRLMPSDTIARVTPITHHAGHRASAVREVEIVDRLGLAGSPVAVLDPRVEPRVLVREGFQITFWTYYEQMPSSASPPTEYLQALRRLHADLRNVDVAAPHVMERVGAVQQDVADRGVTPELADPDRMFLTETLRDLRRSIFNRRAAEQLLHGEPHSMNVLMTEGGPRFIDFENTCRGPVEYDLGWSPQDFGDRYPAVDQDLVDDCRGLVLAMVAAYRWRHDDQHPSGRPSGVAFLDVLRNGRPWPALEDVTW